MAASSDAIDSVLIDTAAFYAVVSPGDFFHDVAKERYNDMVSNEAQHLWTTSYALVETMALIRRRLGFDALVDFVDIIDGNVNIHWIDDQDHNQAWARFLEHGGAGLSLVDWTVALLAETMEATIFTFDRGFVNQGFSVTPRLV